MNPNDLDAMSQKLADALELKKPAEPTVHQIHVMYHDDCLDGIAAAWAVWAAYSSDSAFFDKTIQNPGHRYQVDLSSVAYHRPLPMISPNDHVIIVDFCPDLDDLMRLAVTAKSLTVIDHHPKAEKVRDAFYDWVDIELSGKLAPEERFVHNDQYLQPKPLEVRFNGKVSGCKLAWQRLHRNAAPRLLDFIDDYDRYQFKLRESLFINEGLMSMPLSVQNIETYALMGQYGLEELEQKGKFAVSVKDSLIEWSFQHTMRSVILKLDGERIELPVIQIMHPLTNRALELMEERWPGYPAYVAYYDTRDDQRRFSLRSRSRDGDVCRRLAEAYGGGGHNNAAGFYVDNDHPLASF